MRIERQGAPVSEEVLGLQFAVAGDAPQGAAYTLIPLFGERALAVALIPPDWPLARPPSTSGTACSIST